MNLAIIGSGMIVNDFFNIINDLPEIKLKAIVGTERSNDKMISMQEEYGIENVYVNYEECLENREIDTVYIAVPNFWHFSMAKAAIEYGKNVICEKPFTMNAHEAKELQLLAIKNDVFLLEAITNQYLPNYNAIKDKVKEIGDIRIVQLNYSQYSSRYKSFCEGIVLPAFDPKKGGGALMDINIYNIHFAVGLFGKPEDVQYHANINKNIDTSGVLIMEYPGMQVVSVGAKDANSNSFAYIQGDRGTITVLGPTSTLENGVRTCFISGKEEMIDKNEHLHRMYEEFKKFVEVIECHDMEFAKKQMDHSVMVMEVVQMALDDAGLHLG